MPEVVRNFTVPEKGIGRKDYSVNVETSVEALIRSHQRRTAAWINLTYYSFAWPYVSAVPFILPTVQLYDRAIQILEAQAETNNLIVLSFVKYLGDIPVEEIATSYGYGKAEINFTKGFIYDQSAGYTYWIYFNVIMDHPYPTWPITETDLYTIHIQMHAFEDRIAGE